MNKKELNKLVHKVFKGYVNYFIKYSKKSIEKINLEYKWLGDDLLVFKDNSCMTLLPGIDCGRITYIESIEGSFDISDVDYEWTNLKNNPFTEQEMDYYEENYFNLKEEN